MTKPTGRPPGRPKGSKTKRVTLPPAQMAAVAARVEQVIEGAFGGDAHAFLMTVYKDPSHALAARLAAATAAIRFEKPALQAIDVTSDGTLTIKDVGSEPLSPTEWGDKYSTAH